MAFESQEGDAPTVPQAAPSLHVPREFLDLARTVACHRDGDRWDLLYRALWRITHGERELLEVATDDDVIRLNRLEKAVSRDAHKAKAFVRFRRIVDGEMEQYVAWHRPDHRILPLVAPFFSRRFPQMCWSILTPDESVLWDRETLHFGAGVPASAAPAGDDLEDLWKTYYAAIFNPARIKIAMMKKEMPVRHWRTLPEAQIIPDLLEDATRRVNEMADRQGRKVESAAPYLPERRTLTALAEAAGCCEGCDLHERATQTVFGRGPAGARIMLVGEQPGDQEDLAGEPFIGPAGQLLDRALGAAGLNRAELYLTNAVKHFHWEPAGERRLHKKPPARAMAACVPWLEAEVAAVRPEVLVCLGATAAQVVIGRDKKLTDHRGKLLETKHCRRTLMTWHPSAILRAFDDTSRAQKTAELIDDLILARESLSV